GYFKTVGIPLLYGRDFAVTDDSTSLPVGIVDVTLANRYWRGADALGKRIRTGGDTTWYTIIGVAGAVRERDAALPPEPPPYNSPPAIGGNPLALAIRTDRSSAGVIAAVRRVLAQAEPGIP